MNDKEIYKLWAPTSKLWVDWVRPVIFMNITKANKRKFKLIDVYTNIQYENNTAIFVDLSQEESVLEGMSYAKMGYRPIVLFNGSPTQKNAFSIVDLKPLQEVLLWASNILQNLSFEEDCAPVFFLDSNRIFRHKMDVSVFDNSWDLYSQDIPTPEYFLNHKINKIIVRSYDIKRDLKRIFYSYQKKGIDIYLTDGIEDPKKIKLNKPPKKDRFH
ncbi:MAG: hypothetical protein GX675_07250 [Erysipelotrichaceae bacterium]|nr:hypothetical protein [Erysipelotrichaceae bacterium]